MDWNTLLWVGGMLFSLGIFAVKVGLGLRVGQAGAKWVGIFLFVYVLLFVMIAFLSQTLVGLLGPVLKKGPILHILVALGLIAWGIVSVRGLHRTDPPTAGKRGAPVLSSYLLIMPCPVCLTAMTFSTWTALAVIKLPPALVGLGLGLAFALMTLAVLGLATFKKGEHPETALGLTMITIGLYFVASLFLPARIEEARGMYASLATSSPNLNTYQAMGVAAILLALMLIGFFAGKYREVKK